MLAPLFYSFGCSLDAGRSCLWGLPCFFISTESLRPERILLWEVFFEKVGFLLVPLLLLLMSTFFCCRFVPSASGSLFRIDGRVEACTLSGWYSFSESSPFWRSSNSASTLVGERSRRAHDGRSKGVSSSLASRMGSTWLVQSTLRLAGSSSFSKFDFLLGVVWYCKMLKDFYADLFCCYSNNTLLAESSFLFSAWRALSSSSSLVGYLTVHW